MFYVVLFRHGEDLRYVEGTLSLRLSMSSRGTYLEAVK